MWNIMHAGGGYRIQDAAFPDAAHTSTYFGSMI
jgi:hypothetical protein